jgi:hypothetical protein
MREQRTPQTDRTQVVTAGNPRLASDGASASRVRELQRVADGCRRRAVRRTTTTSVTVNEDTPEVDAEAGATHGARSCLAAASTQRVPATSSATR